MTCNAEHCLRLLYVEPDATVEEIRRAYREAVFVWHPDRLPAAMHESATRRLTALREAQSYLLSPQGLAERDQLASADDGISPDLLDLTLVEVCCKRCGGAGTTVASLSSAGHFDVAQCPVCLGSSVLICVAGSQCRCCDGDGRGTEARSQSRAAYLRSNMLGVSPGTASYRLRYRRMVLRYETTVLPCSTCRGAGYTFFKPDARRSPPGDEPATSTRAKAGRATPNRRRRSPAAA